MRDVDRPDPSIKTAVRQVLDLGHRVLLDRIALLRLEAKEDLHGALRAAGLVTAGGILLFYGWLLIAALIVYGLHSTLPFAASLGVVAAIHLVAGVAVTWWGVRAVASIRFMEPDDDEARRRERQVISRTPSGES